MDRFICNVCNGRKGWRITFGYGSYPDLVTYREKWKRCPRCHGEGYLDWIENIVSKKHSIIPDHRLVPPSMQSLDKNKNIRFLILDLYW